MSLDEGRKPPLSAVAMGMAGLALSDIAMVVRMMSPPEGLAGSVVLVAGLAGGALGYAGWFTWQVTTIRRRAGAVGSGVLLDGTVLGLAAAAVFAVLIVRPQLAGTSSQIDQLWLLGCLIADTVLAWLAIPVLTTRPSQRARLITIGLFAHVGFDLTHAYVFGDPSFARLRVGEILALTAFACWFSSFRVSDSTQLSQQAVSQTAQIRTGGLVAALAVPIFISASLLWPTDPDLTWFLGSLGLTLAALVAIRIRRLVSNLAEMQAEITRQAEHDHLTGVWNRAALANHISQLEQNDALRAVLYMDLDGFKEVNDTFGHDAGDHVLVTIAGRLKETVRGTDRVARIGGDEFVVVVTDADTDIDAFVERLTTVLNHQACLWQGSELNVGASIGLAYGQLGSNQSDVAGQESMSNTEMYNSLLVEADAAMFRDKEARKAVSSPG